MKFATSDEQEFWQAMILEMLDKKMIPNSFHIKEAVELADRLLVTFRARKGEVRQAAI